MNHNTTILTVTAIVAAMAVTGIGAMATPALAGGHHHGVKVSQTADQANVCSGQQLLREWLTANDGSQSTVCLNQGTNNADIQR